MTRRKYTPQLLGFRRRTVAPVRNVSRRKYCFLIAFSLCIAGVLSGRIYCQRQINRLGSDWEQKRRELVRLEKETANLKMQRETYLGGRYILSRATEMGLQPSLPGQVRVMGHRSTDENGRRLVANH